MIRSRLCLAVLLAVSAGCAGTAEGPQFGQDRLADRITIEVRNDSFADATLHVHRAGQRTRLGTVTALAMERFQVPWPQPQDLQISIRLLAGRSCITRELPVDPGDIINLHIENDRLDNMDCIRTGP